MHVNENIWPSFHCVYTCAYVSPYLFAVSVCTTVVLSWKS